MSRKRGASKINRRIKQPTSRGTKIVIAVVMPLLVVWRMWYLLWSLILCVSIWLTWGRRNVLFVYSDSPTWKSYLEEKVIPRIQDRTVLLNWSQRRSWKTNSLSVLAYRQFRRGREFCPYAIVFRPFCRLARFRFYSAFKDFKHADPRALEKIKQSLFDAVGA